MAKKQSTTEYPGREFTKERFQAVFGENPTVSSVILTILVYNTLAARANDADSRKSYKDLEKYYEALARKFMKRFVIPSSLREPNSQSAAKYNRRHHRQYVWTKK